MIFDVQIIAGSLQVKKDVFVREMLSRDSILRVLINCKTSSDFPNGHPSISEADAENMITIDFKSMSYVNIGDQLEKLLKGLKQKYGGQIRGKITCSGIYRNMYSYELNLNTDDDTVEFSMI
jgi:hypothetical protein